MHLVIDANIIVGQYKESILETTQTDLTASTLPLFARLESGEDVAYVDDEGHIEFEWDTPVPDQWFKVWYQRQLQARHIRLIPTENHPKLLKKLEQLGFPRSRDRWYVRVAKTVVDYFGECSLITEDGDFYDPKKKGSSSNKLSPKAPVPKLLRKENIIVQCVFDYLDQFDDEDG